MRPAALLLACFALACRTAPRAPARPARPPSAVEPLPAPQSGPPPDLLATAGDIAVLALDAPGFSALPREQRLLAYWLTQAANAGDSIAVDQGYRHNLEVVRLLRGILTHPQAVQPVLLPPLRAYARAIYLNHGLHDAETGQKLLPPLTLADLRQAALAAQAAGAELGVPPKRLEFELRALEAAIFDPRVDALRTSRGGPDPLTASAVNLYDGVALKDLDGFRERYPLNSRLVKDQGKLGELVARAGPPAGLYADKLARVVAALDQALPYATSASQRQSLEQLIAYLRSGDPDRFRDSQREWLKEAAPVDYVIGFIETYADPRGLKAMFEGFVGIEDKPRSEVLQRLAQSAQYFEERMPWAAEWKRAQVRPPAAEALVLVGASGENRPQSFSGVNLPNDQAERERLGSKSLLLPAFDEAVAEARGKALAREFNPKPVADALAACLPQQRFAQLAFHEMIGHASGKVSGALRGDPSAALGASYHTLEEARAELVAHFLVADPRTREIGLLPDARCQELYPQYATTQWFTYVARVAVGERVEEDHQRADQLMIWWFTGKGAIAERQVDGKRYLAVTDAGRWHAAAGDLLALLQNIKSTGHAARLRDLVELHASRLDTRWRDEVIARLKALGVPRRVAALAPVLRPVLADGKVVDASAEKVTDLDAQILTDWSGY
jgi:dipeptidyl-peptidase-3